MNPLRVVVVTGGGLGVPIAERIATLADVTLAGVVFERPRRKSYSLLDRWRRNIRYRGTFGTLAHFSEEALSRLKPRRTSLGGGVDADAAALQAIASRAAATFVATSDMHSPEILRLVVELAPELGVVVGTTIIKPTLYDIPRLGSINLHQGQVPEYRGSATCFWALYNQERDAGITIHRVVRAVDAGEVVLSTTLPLEYDFPTFGTSFEAFERDFSQRMKAPSIELMVEAVRRFAAGTATSIPQDDAKAVRRRKPTFAEQQQLRGALRQRFTKTDSR